MYKEFLEIKMTEGYDLENSEHHQIYVNCGDPSDSKHVIGVDYNE